MAILNFNLKGTGIKPYPVPKQPKNLQFGKALKKAIRASKKK